MRLTTNVPARLVSKSIRMGLPVASTWSLVAASQAAAEQMLDRHPVRHVFLASGACLPLRPLLVPASSATDAPATSTDRLP